MLGFTGAEYYGVVFGLQDKTTLIIRAFLEDDLSSWKGLLLLQFEE